eukprot:Phypoly_transcript_18075.p1 GENE.Phypoly_transcript_18075~~Phypoly_transcript_18075.p1  ORF type:complete len:253 (+),score=54.77 Phypoly_transcript_18075:81-761(+)
MNNITKEKKRKGRESIQLGHNLNAPPSTSPTHVSNSAWHIQLEHAIHNAGPEELRNIIAQLKTTTGNAQMKLLSVSTKIEDLVLLVDSNQTHDQDLSFNRNSRKIDATFAVGPNRHPLSLSITNTNTEGENDVKVETDLFLIEEGEFEGPTRESLREFFEATKITNFTSTKYSGTDTEKAMLWFLGDVIYHSVGELLAKYGPTDEFGVDIGFGQDDIYERLQDYNF